MRTYYIPQGTLPNACGDLMERKSKKSGYTTVPLAIRPTTTLQSNCTRIQINLKDREERKARGKWKNTDILVASALDAS